MRKNKQGSMFRRLVYFLVMTLTGGGAGMGGWAFKDHPRMRDLLGVFWEKAREEGPASGDLKDKLVSAVGEVLNTSRGSGGPGRYKVKIAEVQLDPRQFDEGRVVDIQARVRKIDAQGRETTVWESKPYGENLAKTGKDDLTASWINRPFEVEWSAEDNIVVEVWDRRAGLLRSKEYKMALPTPGTFPLASGIHPLQVAGRDRSARDSQVNRIVFEAERTSGAARRPTEQVASDRTIVIK